MSCINRHITSNPNGHVEVQKNDYYPFGGIIADLSTGRDVQNRLYNGKELDTSNNLWWYDYGARQYDPTAPRFLSPDRYSEKYYSMNMYGYCGNNPIKYIDLRGDSLTFHGEDKDIKSTIKIMNKYGTGKYYQENGKIIHDSKGKEPNEYDKIFDDAINSNVNININIVSDDDNVKIANWESKEIDIKDIEKMKGGKTFFTPGSVLGHEIKEQTILQTTNSDINYAHKMASKAEYYMTGQHYYIDQKYGRLIEGSEITIIGTSLIKSKKNKEKTIEL